MAPGAHLEDERVSQHAVPGHPQPLVLAARLHLRQSQRPPRGRRSTARHVTAGATPHRGWGRRRRRAGAEPARGREDLAAELQLPPVSVG